MSVKTKTVYMPWIAAELRNRGFELIKVIANPNKPQFDAYVFEDTPELREAFTIVSNSRK